MHRGGVADIADLQFHFRVEIGRPLLFRTMHLRAQIVKNADAVTVMKKFVCEVRPDKSGTTRDQNLLSHLPFLMRSSYAGCFISCCNRSTTAKVLTLRLWLSVFYTVAATRNSVRFADVYNG